MGEQRNIGIIVATSFDRNGNDLVIRGSLNLFGKSIAEMTYDILKTLNLSDIYVYTNSKGVALKNIFGKKVKYIIRKNKYLYSSLTFKNEFSEYLNDVDNILFIDPKYPFLDSAILNELIETHIINQNGITYVKCEFDNNILIPNISVMTKTTALQLFNKTEYLRQSFDINNIIMHKINDCKIGYKEISSLHQIMPLSNGKIINNVEKLLKNRK